MLRIELHLLYSLNNSIFPPILQQGAVPSDGNSFTVLFEQQQREHIMSIQTINLVDFGDYLDSPEMGIQTYQRIEEYWEGSHQIVCDFDSVLGMTGRFANEAFGQLFAQKGSRKYVEKMSFHNLNAVVEIILKCTLYRRYEELHGGQNWLN